MLLIHRNLVPVAFKQKVLQVSNTMMQRSLQVGRLAGAMVWKLLHPG